MSRINERYGALYARQSRLYIGSDTFTSTTIPGLDVCQQDTQPLPTIDICAIDTQPLPKVKRSRRSGRHLPMLWWSAFFGVVGLVALVWAKSVVGLLACAWIGGMCGALWLLDVLIIRWLFRS